MARGRSRSTQVGERTVCTTSNTNLPPEKGPNDSPECWQAYIWLSAHEAGKQASTSDFACSFTDGWCWSMTCSEFHATHRDVRGPSGRSLFFGCLEPCHRRDSHRTGGQNGVAAIDWEGEQTSGVNAPQTRWRLRLMATWQAAAPLREFGRQG